MATKEKTNAVATTDNAEGEQVKHGWLRRAGGWVYHTFADTPTENNDNRDIVQCIADSFIGPTPGRKVARTSAAAGAGTAIAGIASGSITLLTVGGITFFVGGSAELIQWYRGRHSDEEVVDTIKVEDITDQKVVEDNGVAEAAKSEDNLYTQLKKVAIENFKMTAQKWDNLWTDARNHEKFGRKFKGAKKARYNDIVNVASSLGLVKVKTAPATS